MKPKLATHPHGGLNLNVPHRTICCRTKGKISFKVFRGDDKLARNVIRSKVVEAKTRVKVSAVPHDTHMHSPMEVKGSRQ